MDSLLDALREFDAIRDGDNHQVKDIVATRVLAANPPLYDQAGILTTLDARIRAALDAIGVSQLYEHQSRAISAALHGQDVVLEAPTASGKTLSFLIPLLSKLVQKPASHGLMLHPMKALSNDQRRQLEEFTRGIPNAGRDLDSWPFDGDTDKEHRNLLKNHPPAILLTNPEMLHQSFLGWHQHWDRFLPNVQFIIIDEIHEYRGYFGTNCALLIRRLLKKLNSLGARPQVFLASATCANPEEHAFRLTGRNCTPIRSANNMRPERHFAFINPVGIPDYRFQDIFQIRVANAALACLSRELTTLAFCPSRKFAEDVSRIAKREAEERGYDPEEIVPYRSGYTAQERRSIEDGLRSGKYKIIFSTNALELGIDIGRLDVCILAGFPDSIMSAWQRIGRVGRTSAKPAYVLFYAMNNAVDQFYADNIDSFLNKPLDQITVGLDNEELIDQHIPFLLHENAWEIANKDRDILGDTFCSKARKQSSKAKPMKGGHGPSYQRLSLRGGSHAILTLVYHGTEIGTISDTQAFHEAYVGAIYNHCGKSYKVESHAAKEISLVDAEPHVRSIPYFYTVTQDSDLFNAVRYKEAVSAHYGKLTIFENFSGYRIEDSNGNTIDQVQMNLAMKKQAHAFWLTIEDTSQFKRLNLENGTRALEQLLRLGAMFVIPSDRHDTNTFSNSKESFGVYLYEDVPGGIGIAEKAFSVWRDAVKSGMNIAEQCDCKDGCPRCIFPPRLRDTKGMSKSAGLKLAERILGLTDTPPDEKFDPSTHGWQASAIS